MSGLQPPPCGEHADRERHAEIPHRLLWRSFRALTPTLLVDVGGTVLAYYLLLPYFSHTSIWPLIGASLVPVVSNTINFIRRRTIDIVGLIVLIGLIAGIAGALFGGTQRLVLLRGSFVTGFVGLLLLLSAALHKPLGYFVVREFLTANEAIPAERFHALWVSAYFRHGVRVMTVAWGVLLVGEFFLRAFMALSLSISFVLGVSPIIFTVVMLVAGVVNAVWLSHAIRVAST